MTENKIVSYKNEIKVQVLGNKEVFNALAKNTFKGLDEKNIPSALLEGMMRGYSIQDFMVKKIYATPFWNSKENRQDYALVQSISDVRAIAMKSGQSGKSEPKYTETLDVFKNEKTNEVIGERKKIETCSVTVWKKDGDDRGFTATVYFDEYEKPAYKNKQGKEIPGMWQTKPRTMIAKVAEMHALRMAFPEELQNVYIEEEFDKESVPTITVEIETLSEEEIKTTVETIKGFDKLADLQSFFKTLKSDFIKNKEIVTAYNAQKELCQKTKPTK